MTLRPDSLRFRFLISTVVWIGLGIVLAGILVSGVFRWNLVQGYHDELSVHLDELAALATLDPAGQPYMLRHMSDPRFLPRASGFYWEVEREGFRTIASPSLGTNRLSDALATQARPRFAWTDGPHGQTLEYARLQPAADGGPPLRLLIASDKWLVDATMAEFNRSLAISLIGFALLMIGGGILQVRFGLKPLDRLAQAIADIRSGRSERMQGKFPAEIRPLVSDLNGLLDSSAASVSRSRVMAGNLAHGLRTPLAILIDEADCLRRSGNPAAADTIMQEAQRMKRQIDFHLARARTAAAQPLPGQIASLQATLEPLIRAFTRLHQQRRIEFRIVPGENLKIACDPVDLAEILSNLLDNAGKWATSRCSIDWQRLGSTATIEIKDDGPGLPVDVRETVFEIGARLDDLTPGTGLGLAISRDLARIYGGDVELGAAPGGGVCATIRLPVV